MGWKQDNTNTREIFYEDWELFYANTEFVVSKVNVTYMVIISGRVNLTKEQECLLMFL
jgi:hypothetical protein